MADRDPYVVLGVERGASQATVKAAWRRLARQHHPDLTAHDPVAARAATRRMAQINAAYQELQDGAQARRSASRSSAGGAPGTEPTDLGAARKRGGGPPRPKPTRPVTGRLDTRDTFQGRNRTTTPRGARARPYAGPPPERRATDDREPPRASEPSGPLRRARLHSFRPPPTPELSEARALEIAFGKFRGHTLGEIADFEPSYIDWVASTISRDAGLVAAARAIVADFDRRGVVRRRRETEREQRDSERHRREWQRIFGDGSAS